jgi:hypothetical protein
MKASGWRRPASEGMPGILPNPAFGQLNDYDIRDGRSPVRPRRVAQGLFVQ